MGNRFPARAPRATISDVAQAAGVSKGTVSKYLAPEKGYYIAEETRRRIAEAITKLEFSPNAMAQGLSTRRSNTIGVVVASITNPFYPELIAGVEEVIGATEYTLLLGSTDEQPAKETDIVRSMMQRQVDGLIIAAVTMNDSEIARLAEQDVDVVLASRGLATTLVDTVVIDNELGGRMAAEHLLGHGHTRMAHVTGPLEIVPFALRLEGFRAALAEAGHPLDEELVGLTDREWDSVPKAVARLLDDPNPPTAVFLGNDRMAIEALEYCASRGVRVPQDLAVIGFDNVWVGRLQGVDLTTVDSKAREVGRQAADQLAERMRARQAQVPGPRTEPQRTVLAPELIRRRSCGCDRQADQGENPEPVTASFFRSNRKPVSHSA